MEASGSVDYDGDALRDALASVEPWDVLELSALFELDTAADDEVPERSARGCAKHAPYKRESRKQETLALQTKIASLERIIQSERAKRIRPGAAGSSDILATEWRAIAERQAGERTTALVENEKLRLVLSAQTSDARKIVRLGERVAQLEHVLPPVPTLSFDVYRGPDVDPLEQLEALTRTLEDSRNVFGAEMFRDQGRESISTAHFRSCDPESLDGVEFEFLMGWVLPFGVRDVADALWVQATRPAVMSKTVQFMVIHAEERAEVSRFMAPPLEGQNESFVHGQTATKRWQENATEKLLTNIRGRVINAKKRGFVLSGHEWMRVERVELSDGVDGVLSRIQWCHRVRVRPPNYETMTRKERTAWVHSVVTGPVQTRVKRDLARNIQSIENLLLSPREEMTKSAGRRAPSGEGTS